MGMRRPGARAFGVSGPRLAVVRVAVVRMAVVRVAVVRMRPVECGGRRPLLVAVRRLVLRTGLNDRARSDPEEEGRDDGVRIHPDAYSSSTGDAAPLSRTVSSHAKT